MHIRRLGARALVLVPFLGFIAAGCTFGSYAPQGSPGATDVGFMGCQVAAPPGVAPKDGVDPLASGEPMFGAHPEAMTPRQIGDAARDRGLKVTWRYEYSTGGGGGGFAECWCVPPDDGRVTSVSYGMANELVVFVDAGARDGVRPQPPRGWGC